MFVSAFLLLALPSTSNQLLNDARWRAFRAFTSPRNIAKSQRIAVHPFSLNEMQLCFPIHHSFSLNEMLPLTVSRCVGPWIARLYLSGNGLQKATHGQFFNRGSLLVRNVPAFVNKPRPELRTTSPVKPIFGHGFLERHLRRKERQLGKAKSWRSFSIENAL